MTKTISATDYSFFVARWCASRPGHEIAIISLVLVLVIGSIDYVIGPYVSLSVVYVLPIALAAWFVGQYYAIALAALSVLLWIIGDYSAGLYAHGVVTPTWNGMVRFLFYVLSVLLLVRLHALQDHLNELVRERTAALTKEIGERRRLEENMMEVGNRERRRIGRDLHDGLCQHLAGTALIGHVLAEKLTKIGYSEASEAHKVVNHIEEAITLARGVAKGIYPVEMQPEGLMQALTDFATTTSDAFKVSCSFVCDSPVLLHSPAIATHLYRIAQEAVSNAVQHGHATEITMSLEVLDSGMRLCVTDNGSGIAIPVRSGDGIGLQVMADRAKTIGAKFAVGRSTLGGTEVCCTLPLAEVGRSLNDV